MKKKNHKGFTLTELLAILVILGVIVAIAVPSYNNLSKKFRNNYYEKLDETILTSAKTYFKDHAEERPVNLLESKVIGYSTLTDNKYIDKPLVYKSEDKTCEGKTVIIKVEDDYIYENCMTCGESEYVSGDEKFCDVAWENNEYIFKSYKDIPKEQYIHVIENYSNTTTNINNLRKKLCKGETLTKKNGAGDDAKDLYSIGLDQICPKNITQISLAEKNIFEVKYDDKTNGNDSSTVIVFQHPAPEVNGGDNEITITTDNKTTPISVNNNTFQDETYSSEFQKFQYSIDGKNWLDLDCEPGTKEVTNEITCEVKLPIDSGEILFRAVGKDIETGESQYGEKSKPYQVKQSQLNSSLEVLAKYNNSSGSDYNGDWTNQNIYLEMTATDVTSGMNIYYQVDNEWNEVPNQQFNSSDKKISANMTVQATDNSVINKNYYFKISTDGNDSISTTYKTIKIDKIKPVCTNSGDSTSWINTDRTITWGCSDANSGCKTSNSGGNTLFSSTTRTATIGSYVIYDNAGNTQTCSSRTANVYVDKTIPTLSTTILTSSGSTYKGGWTSDELFLVARASDEHSGLKSVKYKPSLLEYRFSSEEDGVYTEKLDSSINSTIEVIAVDNVTNEATSETTKVQIDQEKPWCVLTKSLLFDNIVLLTSGDSGSGVNTKTVKMGSRTLSKVNLTNYYKYSGTGTITATVTDEMGYSSTCSITISSSTSTSTPTLSAPVINLSSTTQTTKDVTFTITNPNENGDIYYSYDKSNWSKYSKGSVTLLNQTGTKTVYAKVVYNNVSSSISPATGYCNKDTVTVNASTLQGKYFVLSFSLPNSPSGVTPNKYEYAYWGAVDAGEDEINKQSSQATSYCGSTPPTAGIKTTTNAKTANLYMKYQKQYYCFAVRPYRATEIEGINRWTVQRKHAKTTQTINSNNYNGYN